MPQQEECMLGGVWRRGGAFEDTRGCLSGRNPVDEQPFSCDQATAARR